MKRILLTLLIVLWASTTWGRAGDPVLQPAGTVDVSRYGIRAKDAGTTTTVSSWTDSTTVVVGDASSFRVGDPISIERAAVMEGTCDIDGTTVILNLADNDAGTDTFSDGDKVFIANGTQVERQARYLTIRVYGDEDDIFYELIDGTRVDYTVVAADNSVEDVSEGL